MNFCIFVYVNREIMFGACQEDVGLCKTYVFYSRKFLWGKRFDYVGSRTVDNFDFFACNDISIKTLNNLIHQNFSSFWLYHGP